MTYLLGSMMGRFLKGSEEFSLFSPGAGFMDIMAEGSSPIDSN